MSEHVQHDSLPYYDPALTDEEQDQIDELLEPLIPNTKQLHPYVSNLPPLPEPTPFWSAEYERLSKNIPLTAIDTTRYQLSDDPKRNIVALEYLNARTDNLALLETYGSNAWLIGNAISEHSLGLLETELAKVKEDGVKVNRERKAMNLELGGEIDKLKQRWRKALRGVVEVEIANAVLEEEIRELEKQQGQETSS